MAKHFARRNVPGNGILNYKEEAAMGKTLLSKAGIYINTALVIFGWLSFVNQ
jgi:hypothetical protein